MTTEKPRYYYFTLKNSVGGVLDTSEIYIHGGNRKFTRDYLAYVKDLGRIGLELGDVICTIETDFAENAS